MMHLKAKNVRMCLRGQLTSPRITCNAFRNMQIKRKSTRVDIEGSTYTMDFRINGPAKFSLAY